MAKTIHLFPLEGLPSAGEEHLRSHLLPHCTNQLHLKGEEPLLEFSGPSGTRFLKIDGRIAQGYVPWLRVEIRTFTRIFNAGYNTPRP